MGAVEEGEPVVLVTLDGQCFSALFEGKHHARDRDVFLYRFLLEDRAAARGNRVVFIGITLEAKTLMKDSEDRETLIALNVIRRAMDNGTLDFGRPVPDPQEYTELLLKSGDVLQPAPKATDSEVRTFVLHKAYWLGYRNSPDPGRYWVDFAADVDLDYLGADTDAIARIVWLLGQQGLLEVKAGSRAVGKPTHQLIAIYESNQGTEVPGAKVFPKGTQYDSFKEIARIFKSAKAQLTVVDNYINGSLLDMLGALPPDVGIRVLIRKVPADFRVALRAFRAQYAHSLEVRQHSGQVHDRVVIVDERTYYSLGSSIKDAGNKLWIIQKLDDQDAIRVLRENVEQTWNSAGAL